MLLYILHTQLKLFFAVAAEEWYKLVRSAGVNSVLHFSFYSPSTTKDFTGQTLIMNSNGDIVQQFAILAKGWFVGCINNDWFQSVRIGIALGRQGGGGSSHSIGSHSKISHIRW